MDKYEYKVRLDELTELVQLKNYRRAAELADEIDWSKVRNAKTLSMIADIYEAVERYDSCQAVLMQAYAHTTATRAVLGRLTDIAIKSKDVRSAEEFYNEFLEVAPNDAERYVFAYKIACLKDAPLPDRISILEELKEKEYTEMWAYELAVLYAQAGMREQCVETCDELVLWFGDGEYVERALDLKRTFQPLTPAQEAKFQRIRAKRGMVELNVPPQQEFTAEVASEVGVAEEGMATVTKFNTKNLEEEIARSMQQIMEATEENTVRDHLTSIRKIVQDIPYLEAEEDLSAASQKRIQSEVDSGLKNDFQEKLEEENVYGQYATPYDTFGVSGDTSGMSIEEILADWEKTKLAAQEAMAAADQKKLDLEKEQALAEANDILRRLQELVPIISSDNEEIPDANGKTVADELLAAEPIITDPEAAAAAAAAAGIEPEKKPETVFDFFDEDKVVAPHPEQNTRPLQQVASRVVNTVTNSNRVERTPVDRMANVETLGEWPDAGDAALEAALAREMQSESFRDGNAAGFPAAPGQNPMTEPFVAPESTPIPKPTVVPEPVAMPESSMEAESFAASESAAASGPGAVPEPKREAEAESVAAPTPFVATAPPMQDDFPEEEEMEAALLREAASAEPEPEPAAGYGQAPYRSMPTEPLPFYGNAAPPVPLTAEMEEIFSYFIPIPGMAEQLSQVLGVIVQSRGSSVTSATGNLIVQGEEGSGKTILATDLIKAAQIAMGLPDAKSAKINASALNKRSFSSLVPKIAGGYLIVEDAGKLDMQTIEEMSQAMDQNTGGMTVILEDDGAGIYQALSTSTAFAAKFTARIETPDFTIDELVSFGRSYVTEQECVMDEMAVLALYNRINNIQKLDRPTMLAEVKDIIDQAIDKAESGGLKKMFAKKYDENDYLILREEDFE